MIETGSLVLGAIASVTLAVAGLGGAAIVLGAIVAAIASSAATILIAPPGSPRWHGPELREILDFGGPASGAGFLHVAITNVAYTVLAARLSGAQVGFYWRAFQFGVSYQEKISGIMLRLAFPVYSRTQDLDQMSSLHERATRVHAAVVVPLLAIFIAIAPVFVPWILGPRWEPSVTPAQILAVAGMIAAVLTGFPQVLLAAGRTRALMFFNLGLLAVYAVVVYATASYGIVAVAAAVVGVYVLQLLTVYLVLFRRIVGISVDRMVSDLAPAVASSGALLAVALPLTSLLRSEGAAPVVIVACVSAIALLVHCTVLRTLFAPVWHDVSTLVRRVLPAGLSRRRRREPVTALGAQR
jgi:O-antigen/teichoic acid export membrane protein